MRFARETNDPDVEALAYSGLARVGFLQGEILSGAAHTRHCIDIARRQGLDSLVYGHLHMVGLGLQHELRLEEALTWMTDAAQNAFQTGAPRQAVISNYFCAEVLYDLGRYSDCREYAERSKQLAIQTTELRYLPGAQSILAKLDAMLGEVAEFEDFLRRRWESMTVTERRFSGPLVLGALAIVTDDIALSDWALQQGKMLRQGPSMRQFL